MTFTRPGAAAIHSGLRPYAVSNCATTSAAISLSVILFSHYRTYFNSFVTAQLSGLKSVQSDMMIGLAWVQDGRWKLGMVHRIRIMLGFQAEACMLMVRSVALSDQ